MGCVFFIRNPFIAKRIDMQVNDNSSHGLIKSSTFLFTLILICFFISGFTGLIYEILWTRLIVKVIGSAPFSVSIVLTVFMGGLGLGSYLAGKRIDRIKNPLTLVRIYGVLELIIAAYGLVFPLLLIVFKPVFSLLYNQLFSYFWLYNLITFIGCCILLIIPVTCMGATLPVLCRFFVTRIDSVGTHIGRLYGLNTIGAAFGSLICGFWLIQVLNVHGTLILAVCLNSFIGMVCLLVSREKMLSGSTGNAGVTRDIPSSGRERTISIAPEDRKIIFLALLIFAVSGFSAMAYEVIWIKLLGIIIGPTTYSFTIVLVTFISCLALGSLFFGRLADRVKNTMHLLLYTQVFAAIAALYFSQIMGESQVFFSKLIFHYKDSFTVLQIVKASVLFAFMFIPTFFLGATFPLVGKICTKSLENTGWSIGSAYAVNTVGAVLGSFSAGFVLVPLLGKENSIRLVSGIQLMIPLVAALLVFTGKMEKRKRLIPLIVSIFIGLFLLTVYPSWDRKMLSTGKYHRAVDLGGREFGWLESLFSGMEIVSSEEKRELVYFGDGIGGFTTVMLSEPDILGDRIYSLYNSGKADASSSQKDMYTQLLLAHFPMLFHEDPKTVLVLGLASGITSGEVLHYPVDRLDTIEINQQVVEASNFFIPWNNNLLQNPKSNLIIQDGRAHLELTNQTYDVIISEPSNPWMAGLASLFTHEFMTLARNRLNENGIYVQWLHSYQMDWPTFALIGRTFSEVFPKSLIVTTDPLNIGPDFLLVGFKGEYRLKPEIAEKNLSYAVKSTNMTFLDSTLFYRQILNENLSVLFENGPINTDNEPVLEFSAPKLLHYLDSTDEIAGMIRERRSLRDKTMEILSESLPDTEKQIDYLAYLLSFGKTFPKMDSIPNVSAVQKKRMERHLIDYCRKTPLQDFSFIADPGIRKACVLAHIEVAEKSTYEDKAAVYYYMGYHCLRNNLKDEGIHYFQETIKLDPDNASAHFNLGYLLFHQRSFLLAADHFRKALKIRPEDDQTKQFLKDAEAIIHKIDASIQQFEKAAEQNPDNHLICFTLADLNQKKGDFQQAIIWNEKALSIKPDFIHAINKLAFLHSMQKEYDKSIEYFKRMIPLRPFQSSIYYNIACLYSKQNRIEESIHWLQQAVENGYHDWEQIRTDEDLSAIRNTDLFFQLEAKYSG
ncbi:MAG: hypothetical protein C4522_12170 [Desulfobacteraceae bacterium]|nr:MAG: hypothetical protein C4522_12170 [Desulfobacteraceae bacterium]